MMGRPSSYSQAIADEICDRLSLGESLREITIDDGMPDQVTIYRWLRREGDQWEAFRQQYARAREDQADTLVDECREIADDGRNDWMERTDKDGNCIGWQINGEAVARSKLRVEQRRWHAGKLRPRVYGDKLDVTSGGEKIGGLAAAIEAGNKRVEG